MNKKLQIKIGQKVIYTCTWRRVIYMLCFFFLCVTDQRIKTCSGLDGLIETFRNLTGVVIAFLIISHYRWKDFAAYKVPYLVLAGLCTAGGAAALAYGSRKAVFFNSFLAAVLDVILFCFILMHTFIAVVLEKKRPVLKKSFLAVWAAMMALMIFSRSDYLWPFCFLIIFGCFYLTDFTREERADMLQGALNGVILGFFILQGLCFVFRPYDVVRYQGFYHNPNMNALFYTEVLAAVLGKLLYVYQKKTGKAIKVFYWLGGGVVISFLFMSIGRASWVASFFLVLVAFRALNRILQKKRFWCHAGILLLCACLMFPVCFSAVRYMPLLFHHPIWFWGEYSADRVHSYDPWDSWKYVEIDEFMDAALGRIGESFRDLWENTGAKRVKAAGLEVQQEYGNGAQSGQEVDDRMKPVMEHSGSGYEVRKTIYLYYAKRLNLRGYPADEQGFQLTPGYHIGHAHNIFLQYGTDFGIPVMVLFTVLAVWGALRLWGAFLDAGNFGKTAVLLYLLIPVLFGMFEYSWGTGSLSITMLFLALGEAMREEVPAGTILKNL